MIPVLLGGAMAPSADMFDVTLRSTIAPLLALDMHTFQGKNDDWNHQFVRLRSLLEAVPGVPAPRYRVPSDAEPPPFHAIGQSVARHFSDADGRLADLYRTLEAAGVAAAVSSVAIHGMGGVGKTQLALKYSHDFRDRYAGVWWLRAETDDILQLDAVDACRATGAPVGDREAPALAFKRWLDNAQSGAPPWLLVFDYAEDPSVLRSFLPERGGHHVLITSRNPAWGGIAKPLATDPWSAAQGADFLAQRLAERHDASDRGALRSLAVALGGLPLALEQAAGFLDETDMSVADYLTEVHRHDDAKRLLEEGRAATGYEHSVLATLAIAFPRLDEAATQLLRLLGFCAPEPVPESLFTNRPTELLPALAAAASQPVAWNKAVAALRRFGLVERNSRAEGPATLQVHRLIQMAVRHQLADAPADAGAVLSLLFSALPLDARSPAHWPVYSLLVPHAVFAGRWGEQVPVDRRKLCDALSLVATFYQFRQALYGPAVEMFEHVLTMTRGDLGEEHADTLTAMNNLALALSDLGIPERARELQEKVLAVSRRTRGEEHPDTLTAMNNLAWTLAREGELGGARGLQEQALAVSRRILGEEHAGTLSALNGLAAMLAAQGELGSARELQEQVIKASRRLFGEEHPHTLQTMGGLAHTLRSLGDPSAAHALQEQVLAVTRRVLGEEHPETLTAMKELALTLEEQGDLAGARKLREQVLKETRHLRGDQHADTLDAMGQLALTLRNIGDWCALREIQELGLAVTRRARGDEHLDTLRAMGRLASTQLKQGDLGSARAFQEQALAGMSRVLGDEHLETLVLVGNLALTLWRSGEHASALKLMQRAVEGSGAQVGAVHPTVMSMSNDLAAMRTALGEAD